MAPQKLKQDINKNYFITINEKTNDVGIDFYQTIVALIIVFWIGFKYMDLLEIDNSSIITSAMFVLPFNVRNILLRISNYKQSVYNKVLLILFDIPIINFIIIRTHICLLYFRYYTTIIPTKLENFISMNFFACIIATICSRLNIAGYMFILILIFIKLDFAVVSMARFYRSHPGVFQRNFTSIPKGSRGMWSQAGKIISEAASNPYVQATAAAGATALGWKLLDVYDTGVHKDVAEADRVAENERADADRVAENERAEADRLEENRRSAFSILNSSDFNNLSDEQKERIRCTVETGQIK